MKPEFHDDFVSDKVDPTTEPYSDFDWDELYQRLGEATDGKFETEVNLSLTVRYILRWVFSTNLKSNRALHLILRRLIALGWVTNPWFFDGKSISAIAAELGLPKQLMSRCAAAASRKFGIENRSQAHAWNRGLKRSANARRRATARKRTADQINTAQESSSALNAKE